MKAHRKPIGWLQKASPTILICVSAVGVVATAVLAAKATPKAKELIEKAKEEKIDEELTTVETVIAAAPAYIPAAVSGVLTVVCMFGSNHLSRKTQASLASAYALLENYFKRYRGQVNELFGEDADEKVIESIPEVDCKYKEIGAATLTGYCTLDFGVDDEEERMFYDVFSNRKFKSTISRVLQAEYAFNKNYLLGYSESLNDFYELLGLDPVDGGDKIGWNMDDGICWVDFNHSKTVLDDGFEYLIISFEFDPDLLYEYDYLPSSD